MRLTLRVGLATSVLLLLATPRAFAEWQIKPSLGVTFGTSTNLIDLENAAGSPHLVVGISSLMLGEVVGVEADVGYARKFFGSGLLVAGSSATTVTGNLVVALPRRLTQYTLRPYFVGGAGLVHVGIAHPIGGEGLRVDSTRPAIDIGGGVTGFLSRRIGISWDVRYFRSVGTGEERGLSFGPEQLSFWRANMALAIRY